MNTMIMSALAAFGIAGFFSAAQSDPKNADGGCCAKTAADQEGKKKADCCEPKPTDCCVKKDPCCDAKAIEGKQDHQSSHCMPERKPKAGTDAEGSNGLDKHEHNHKRTEDSEKAGHCGSCMK